MKDLTMNMPHDFGLETKFSRLEFDALDALKIEGYASFFGQVDQGNDIVTKGAYQSSLRALKDSGRSIKMLWQHDPGQPIGVWDEVREDDRGLYVKGRLLPGVAKAQEVAELLQAGAIDGLSIGYRTVKSTRNKQGHRLLTELDLWEVSLVTFPMLPEARVGAKSDDPHDDQFMRDIAEIFTQAQTKLAGSPAPTTLRKL